MAFSTSDIERFKRNLHALGIPDTYADAFIDAINSGGGGDTSGLLSRTGGTMSGALAMGTNKITGLGTPTASTDAATKAYVDSGPALPVFHDFGNVGATFALGLSQGDVLQATLTSASCAISIANPAAIGSWELILYQDISGSRVVTWPSDVRWSAGLAPTLTTTAGHFDRIFLTWNGTQFFGSYLLNYTDTPPPVVTPDQIANLQFWVEATDAGSLTLSGANVTQWNDKSGNSRNVTPPSTAPTYSATGINSQPGVLFTTSGCPLVTAANFPIIGDANMTIFAVVKITDITATGGGPWGFGDGGAGQAYGPYLQTSGYWEVNSPGSAFASTTLLSNSPALFAVQKTSGGNIKTTTTLRLNGANLTPDGSGSTNSMDLIASKLYVGQLWNSAGLPFGGYIGALVIYDRALSPTEIGQVETYLNGLYSIY